MLLLLFFACAARAPLVLFPDPLPALEPGGDAELFEPAADECPAQVPVIPGRVAPHTDADGLATCRAQLVPESWVADWIASESLGDYWAARAAIGREARVADRIYAQSAVDLQFATCEEVRLEATRLRLAAPASFVLGSLVGGAVVFGAVQLAP